MIGFNEKEVKNIIDDCFSGIPYSKDIVTTLKVTKTEAKTGVTKEIVINRSNLQNNFCFCEEKELITIPKNTKNNTVLKLKERGNQYTENETRGNLYVKVHIFGSN